jgi:azobenzene reductase
MRRSVLLVGSMARPSRPSLLLARREQALVTRPVAVCRRDQAEWPFPFADPARHDRPARHPSPVVRQLAAAAGPADALVLGSPPYHNSYSGVLKNALDHLSVNEVHGRPAGLVGHAGAGTQALGHLRLVVCGLHGIAILTQVATADAGYSTSGGTLELSGAAARDRLSWLADELLWYADRLSRPPGRVAGPGGALEASCLSG